MKNFNSVCQLGSLILVLFALIASTNQLSAQSPLNYGDVIHLQNAWNNYDGGYLDTRGYQRDYAKTGNFLCVSTATSNKRGGSKSGSWKIMSASNKADGSPVLIGDDVYLFNQWNGNGGYLDTRGYQRDYAKTGNHLCVSTATSNNRANGSGTWRISSASGNAAGTAVTENSQIHLQNGWENFAGGYLDTRGYQRDYAKTGNHLCVSTATSNNRGGGSGTWRVTKVTRNTLHAGEKLGTGDKLVSANSAYMAIMQTDGNLCVYKYENGKQGGFVWCSMKHGFNGGSLIMQTDGNLCVVDSGGAFKWGSYQVQTYALGAGHKAVLTDSGKLNVVSSSGEVLWSN